jgi:hypothetical protein
MQFAFTVLSLKANNEIMLKIIESFLSKQKKNVKLKTKILSCSV